MAIAHVATAAAAHGTASCSPAYPAGISANNLLLLAVAVNPSTATMPTISGWTKRVDQVLGSRRQALYTKDTVSGSETGTVSVAPTSASNVSAAIGCYSSAAGFNVDYGYGADTSSNTSFSATADHVLGETTNDLMFFTLAAAANTAFSSTTVSATGATYGTYTQRTQSGTTNLRLLLGDRPVTSGTATAATVATATLAGSAQGGAIFARIREGSTTHTAAATLTATAGLSAAATVVRAKAATLTDTFNTQDTSKWTGWSSNVTVSAGRVSIVPNSGYNGINSANLYDLTDSTFSAEIVQVPNAGNGSIEAFLAAFVDGNNSVQFALGPSGLIFRSRVAGTNSDTGYITYSATTHRFWRFREASGTTYWETSSDGSSWTVQRSLATPVALSSVTLSINSGFWDVEPGPWGTFTADNVNSSSAVSADTALTVTATPTAGGLVVRSAATSLSVTAGLSADGLTVKSAGSNLAATATPTAGATRTVTAATSLAVTATLSGDTLPSLNGSATLTVTATGTADTARTATSAASLQVVATTTGTAANTTGTGTATTSTATPTATATPTRNGATALTVTATTTATTSSIRSSTTLLPVTANFTADATVVRPGVNADTPLTVTALPVGQADRTTTALTVLPVTGITTATGLRTTTTTTTLPAVTVVWADTALTRPAHPNLTATAGTTATAELIRSATTHLTVTTLTTATVVVGEPRNVTLTATPPNRTRTAGPRTTLTATYKGRTHTATPKG